MADEKIYTNIGAVTAYAYAKEMGGYEGTPQQFATDQANFAKNAQQVREDKESVESTVETFDNTTVPAAVQTVTAEGTRQVGIVGTAGDTQVARVQAEGTTQVGVVQTEGTTQKNAVKAKGDEVIASIPSDYTELTEEVEDLKSSIADVNDYALSAYATDTASGAIATLPDGAEDIPIKQLSVAIEPVQEGSGDPSPDNIRPISGHTECNVTRTGKNALALPMYYRADATLPELFFLKAGEYHLSYTVSGASSWRVGMWMKDKDGNNLSDPVYNPANIYWSWYSNPGYWMSGANGNTTEYQLHIEEDCYVRLFFGLGDVSASTVFNNQQLELGTSKTSYEAYQGTTYPITFPSGTTVYGGNITVNRDGSGSLVVDRLSTTESSSSGWSVNAAEERAIKQFADIKVFNSNTAPSPYVSSNYLPTISFEQGYTGKKQGIFIGNNSKNVCIHIDGVTTVSIDALDTYLSEHPLQIVYELATPISIPLTAPQITTLLGTNNLWADCNGDVSVTYRADTALYISKKIAEALNA